MTREDEEPTSDIVQAIKVVPNDEYKPILQAIVADKYLYHVLERAFGECCDGDSGSDAQNAQWDAVQDEILIDHYGFDWANRFGHCDMGLYTSHKCSAGFGYLDKDGNCNVELLEEHQRTGATYEEFMDNQHRLVCGRDSQK